MAPSFVVGLGLLVGGFFSRLRRDELLEFFVGTQRGEVRVFGHPVEFVEALFDRQREIGQRLLPVLVSLLVAVGDVRMAVEVFAGAAVDASGVVGVQAVSHRFVFLPIRLDQFERVVQSAIDDAGQRQARDDFTVFGPRKDVLLKDRDLDTAGFFLRLAPGQTLQIKATLGLGSGSQVCVSTFRNHCEPETLRVQRGLWIDNGKDPREFDSFYFQKFYERDEQDRPYWFDLTIESVGVLPAKDILTRSIEILKGKLLEFLKAPVQREEPGWYRIDAEGETFTLGHLVQELLYRDKNVEFVSRDIGHPLVPKLAVRFSTKQQPEKILETFKREALELCENVLRSV